jgi:SAM-dependent methyltransferase
MRRNSSLSAHYFDGLFADDPDPWKFDSSPYERGKYDDTLWALPKPHFRRALEVGCANGALTERLAPRCDRLIAVDVVERALAKARERCAGMDGVTILKSAIPAEPIQGPFDLILLSEVVYYWDSGDIAKAGAYIGSVLEPGGYILLVHWTGETDYPKSADDAVAELRTAMNGAVTVVRAERRPEYRLDLWRRGAA